VLSAEAHARLVIVDVIESPADRVDPRRTHAHALIFLHRGDRFVTIDVALVPHFSGAVSIIRCQQ
jgi:hypothetical protein